MNSSHKYNADLSLLRQYTSIEILRISPTESESGKESKGDINISVEVIGTFCYGAWGSKWNS